MPNNLPDNVRLALSQGSKIEAIRLLRDQTGLGLAEAKESVESGILPDSAPTAAALQDSSAEVKAALAQGQTIQAIKLLRQVKGLSLQQAKAVADEAARKVRPPSATSNPGLGPGEVQRSTRSLTVVVVLVAIVGSIAWLVLRRT